MWKTQVNVPHFSYLTKVKNFPGLPWLLSGKESACQCRRQESHRWVGRIPWRSKWQPTPVSLPGKSHGWRSLGSYSPGGLKRVGQDLMTKNQELAQGHTSLQLAKPRFKSVYLSLIPSSPYCLSEKEMKNINCFLFAWYFCCCSTIFA